MDDLSLLIDLHIDGERQGPGSDACTQKALRLAGLSRDQPLRIADLGCGTGASAMVLAGELHATVIAVDVLQPFLDTLTNEALPIKLRPSAAASRRFPSRTNRWM